MQYKTSNNALNEAILAGQFSGRPFYFSLSNAARESLATALMVEVHDVESQICKAVGCSLNRRGDPYEQHVSDAQRWRLSGGKDAPPFSALLLGLSHAAALMAADEDFGGGNYYDRLSKALEFDASPLRFHGKSTESLWKWFNSWLVTNDYEFGRPTAKTFNSNKYVNYPQSQAVVRAGDREAFHHLFERFGLRGETGMSVDEIKPYLEVWMISSRPNARLKAAWKRPELRDRFCEVVLAELDEWASGTTLSNTSSNKAYQLSLAATFVEAFPEPRFNVFLGQLGEGDVGEEFFTKKASNNSVRLRNDTFGSLRTLSPNPLEKHPAGLAESFRASNANDTVSLTWKPRLVIPLSRSESGPYWQEVSRVKTVQEYIVLVRDVQSVTREVDAYLAAASTGQFRVASSEELAGVPAGWLVYTNVVIIRHDIFENKNIAPLIPLGETPELTTSGGLRLASGIWHSHAPPEVKFLAPEAGVTLVVSRFGDDQETSLICASGDGRDLTINASALTKIGDAELNLKAYVGKKNAQSETLILRSASRPRPQSRQGNDRVIEWSIASASRESKVAQGEDSQQFLFSSSRHNFDSQPKPKEVPECVVHGYHTWEGEYYAPDVRPPKQKPATCKYCGETVLVGKSRQLENRPVVRRKWEPINTRGSKIDHDLLLDALSFLGSGTFSRLESLLASEIDEPWEAREIVQQYSALGFLDLELEPGSGRIRYWSVPSQKAMETVDGTYTISGFRSRATCQSLRKIVSGRGGDAKFLQLDGRPAKIIVSGLDLNVFREISSKLQDPLGRPLEVIPNAAFSIMRQCSELARLEAIVRDIAIAPDDLDSKFDCETGGWRRIDGVANAAGAYRAKWAGNTYIYRSALGKTVSGPYQLMKLFAARSEQKVLHEFNREEKLFLSHWGAEPIGLLERALVACSGDLPGKYNGKLAYRQVPEEIASQVLGIMYPKGVYK